MTKLALAATPPHDVVSLGIHVEKRQRTKETVRGGESQKVGKVPTYFDVVVVADDAPFGVPCCPPCVHETHGIPFFYVNQGRSLFAGGAKNLLEGGILLSQVGDVGYQMTLCTLDRECSTSS